VRSATVVLAIASITGCNDVRDFAGDWRGARVGTSPPLKVGVADGATADLAIVDIDTNGLHGQLAIDNGGTPLITNAAVVSLPGAEADALSSMSFSGSPLRVYLAFVPIDDGAGDALAMIGLYDSRRIDLRLLRGGVSPIYAIFALSQREGGSAM
jgi:hypothetical protein